MEFKELVEKRRSIRSFKPDTTIEVDVLNELLYCAQEAPTWKNTQTGRYYVVHTPEKVAEIKAKLEKGELHVFDTNNFTVNGKQLSADHKADVDTDAAFTPDTIVVENGVFFESKYRSAPYFDVKIDGITIIDKAA